MRPAAAAADDCHAEQLTASRTDTDLRLVKHAHSVAEASSVMKTPGAVCGTDRHAQRIPRLPRIARHHPPKNAK